MARRIFTLTHYLFRTLAFSLAGLLYTLLTLAVWRLFFDPGQQTPDAAYYTLVIGLFGAGLSFLVTLSIAARANSAVNYPLLVRLSSRVEHLTSVLISTLLFSGLLQLLLAILAAYRGPSLTFAQILEIPPIWVAGNILAVTLALHASDLVTAGWSRVYIYGLLALFLFGQELEGTGAGWLGERLGRIGGWFYQRGWVLPGNLFNRFSLWFDESGASFIGELFELVFWPFQALSAAVQAGGFRPIQALAPAILLLYATVLFLLAAEFFSSKDLYLLE
ncbi:MAG: hypothetical protein R3272_08245 [Candidatus Promineifilaceae bacterium]|nr:hypothetical protein [Candidatus Promineifilaceae bacterium]